MFAKYLLRRLVWMVPTLFGITIVCFAVINLAPGSPVDQELSRMRTTGGHSSATGVSDEVLQAIKIQYGFDKPMPVRYLIWLKNIVTLDFGESFTYQRPVLRVIGEKAGISFEFCIVSLLLIYLISVPLGVVKAAKPDSRFDGWSSVALLVIYSIPTLVLAVLLRVLFAGNVFVNWFPLGYEISDNYLSLTLWGKILDRAHHFILPLICYVAAGVTVRVFLMKNSLLDEIRLDYVRTARAKGVSSRDVLLKHSLRNALIPVVTGIGNYVTVYIGGSIVVEQIFNLDGLGLLTWKSVLSRDYNVLMALIFLECVVAMLVRLLTDAAYVFIDPRVDYQ